MTIHQLDLLKRLLAQVGQEDPYVEVGQGRGMSPKTWKSLDAMGLLDTEGRGVCQVWAKIRTGEDIVGR